MTQPIKVLLRTKDDFGLDLPPAVTVQIGRDSFMKTFPRSVSGMCDAQACAVRTAEALGVPVTAAGGSVNV